MNRNLWKDIIKGAVIGVANIAPGISGGTLAISMGIYDRLIQAVNGLTDHLLWAARELAPFAVGAAAGIISLSFIIEWIFIRYPLQACLLFSGLIVGGIPQLYREVRGKGWRGSYGAAALLLAVVTLLPALGGSMSERSVTLGFTVSSMAGLFGAGIVSAAAMVIPGVSGSMLLTVMGYYLPILGLINRSVKALASWDLAVVVEGAVQLLPFGIGLIAGVLLMARLMGYMLERQRVVTYWGILGLVAASPAALLLSMDTGTVTAAGLAAAVCAFLLGAAGASMLSDPA